VDGELGADSVARSKAGECAVHLLSGLRNHDYTSALLERGANVNPRDSLGRTRLMLACVARERGCGWKWCGQVMSLRAEVVVENFLDHGADVGARTSRGLAPVHLLLCRGGSTYRSCC
jgi:hypothetical protein